MRCLLRWSRYAGLLAGALALGACATDVDSATDDPAARAAPPPLGATQQSDTYAGWKVIGSGAFNLDGQADTDRRDLKVLLLAFPHLKFETGPVRVRLEASGANILFPAPV